MQWPECPKIPHLQKPAPYFKGKAVMKGGGFKEISLEDYKGEYLVLVFYPMDFTFVCPTELRAFSERFEEFDALKTKVIAISCDSEYSHLAWVSQPKKQGGLGEMEIPLLSDKTCKIARDYGVLLEEEGVAFRGLFIIDDKGLLRQITINDMPIGRSIDETLRLLQALKYTDEFGEVCPVNWRPGRKTMKPNVEARNEFFKADDHTAGTKTEGAGQQQQQEAKKETSEQKVTPAAAATKSGDAGQVVVVQEHSADSSAKTSPAAATDQTPPPTAP